MKNGFLLLLAIVIVIVSLSWFHNAKAQSVSGLSEEDKARLTELYKKKLSANGSAAGSSSYTTPPIYDSLDNRNQSRKSRSQTTGLAQSLANARSLSDSLAIYDLVTAGRTNDFTTPNGNTSILNNTQVDVDSAAQPSRAPRMPEFEELKPFGMDLFEHADAFEQPSDITASSDYVLGPGDNILINLWGNVERDYNLSIDRQGSVFIPKVGEIAAWGMTISDFTERCRQMLSKSYSAFQLSVSLGKIRTIRVYITGEVVRPGAYTVSSLTSVLNALYVAGGPSTRGSLRSIKLMRRGTEKTAVDLYDLLLKGENASDLRLEGGDVVFVPVVGSQVAIRGEVKRSALYELKGNERISDLLMVAGSPTSSAYLDRIMLERVGDKRAWEVRDINLGQDGPPADDVALLDGDRVTVYSVFDMKKNMVAINGLVKHPGYYERNDSTRLSNIITRAQLQDYDVYLDRADLFRTYPDGRIEVIPVNLSSVLSGEMVQNLVLQDKDSIQIYSIHDINRRRHVYIEGEVERPGRYPLYDGMSVEDLIFLAGSFNRAADKQQAEIARVDSVGTISIDYVPLLESRGATRIELKEDDRVFIRRIPDFEITRLVRIEGEVNYPGVYALIKRDETLYSLLTRAGGFTANSFPKGTFLERKSIASSLSRLQVPKLIQRSQPIVEDSLGQRQRDEVFEFDSSSVNRIIIDMNRILATRGKEADVILEPGDIIHVPPTPSGISVLGAVGSNGTIKFVENKNVKYYIEHAGNFTRQSDKGEIRLMRADGEVLAGGGVIGSKVQLGDIIVVPTKVEKNSNWLKTMTTALGAATGVLSSVYIISKM